MTVTQTDPLQVKVRELSTHPQGAAAPSRVRISVVVTNHNYGHYLGPSLASLRSQTSAPDEIIVVDDGSTDGSRRLLDGEDGITVILQENEGQAAAFNAGFAASTGDAILFLDADDVLYPEAIAVIRTLWTGRAAVLCWRLDIIDQRGMQTGRYEKWVPDNDMLPRLLDGLLLPFMPTSANVFSRDAIEWSFPLPTERWRISADALLVRVAVLSGPMRPIAQVLGGYRIHGANNYHRGSDAQTANIHRGLNDIADAGLDLIALARRAGRLDLQQHIKLLASALRVRLKTEELALEPARLRIFFSRYQSVARGAGVRAMLIAWLAGIVLPRTRQLREYAIDPASRPRRLQWILDCLAGTKLRTARYAQIERRSPYDGPPIDSGNLGALTLSDLLESPEWVRNWADDSFALRADRGRFVLERPLGIAHELKLSFASGEAHGCAIKVCSNGLPLGEGYVSEATELRVPLPATNPGSWGPDRIEIVVERSARPRRLAERLRQKSARLNLEGIAVTQTGQSGTDAILPVLGERSFADLGAVVRSPAGEVLVGEKLIGPGERLCLALHVLPAPYTLLMRFAAEQGVGTLALNVRGRFLFSGMIGPAQRIAVELPPDLAASTRIEITLSFRPDSFLDGANVAIESLGWLPGRVEAQDGTSVLSPGEKVTSDLGRTLWPFLGSGWEIDQTGAACMLGPFAELRIAATIGKSPTAISLDIEPLDAFAAETPPLVIVSTEGEERARARIAGRTLVEAPVPVGHHEIALHAAGVGSSDQADANHGGIVLHGIGVASAPDAVQAIPSLPYAPSAPDLIRHLAVLESILEGGGSLNKLSALSDAIAASLSILQPEAVWHLVSPADLERLAAIGVRLSRREGDVPDWGGNPTHWLRAFALAALAGPAHQSLNSLPVDRIPELPEALAKAVARILVLDPGPGADADTLRAHQTALVDRLNEARVILANEPVVSARWNFARDVLNSTWPNGLLFSDLDLKPHVAAFSRALETKLLREGHVLSLTREPPEQISAKSRIGILLRHNGSVPETWIVKGLLKALPPDRADVFVFLTEAWDGPIESLDHAKVISLAGRSVADIVTSIRSAGLDLMVLGAAFHGYMPDAEIAAHRLAPRQIILAAAHYATTGLQSVDEMIMGELQAPEAARNDCTEQVVIVPGTGQVFDFGIVDKPTPTARNQMRKRLGIGKDAVVLTSGAMADKIAPEVLRTWLAVLAERPKAMLVLYPFAANWKRYYDRAGFEHRVRDACEAAGVDVERVLVLPPLGSAGVADMLVAADLYLVAFPYSGATTTVEALRAGLPVVARAERTQRGHQAAGWLEAFGLKEFIAQTSEDYVEVASGLAGSLAKRRAVSRRIRKAETAALVQDKSRESLAAHLLGEPQNANDGHRYFFHHIPKTGGTSFARVLSDWFDVIQEYPEPWGYYSSRRIDLNALAIDQVATGHYWAPEMPLFFRYPELLSEPGWRLISSIRDPLDQALSEYFYEASTRPVYHPDFEPTSLVEFLQLRDSYYLKQFDATEDNWREVIDRYWFIGTLERFRECADYLADALGKPRPDDLPTENATPRSEEPDPETVAIFKANNAVDYEIYDEVNRRLDRLLKPESDRSR